MKSFWVRNPLQRHPTLSTCLALALTFCAAAGSRLPSAHGQGNTQNVVWVNAVNAQATGNNLQKVSGQWDAGANSQQQITSPGSYFEFSVSTGHRMQVGLSNDTSSAVDYTQLKYTFNFWGTGGDFDIREGWPNNVASGTYTTGDVFRIEVQDSGVKYYKNGTLVHASTVAPTYPLVLDTALTAMDATVQNAVIGTTGSIRTDRGVYQEPPIFTLPPAGEKFIDPTFGTQILRATGPADGGYPGLGTFYSTWPTFNSDGTRLLIRKGTSMDAIVKTFHPDTFTIDSGRIDLPVSFGDGSGEGPSWQFAIWSPSDPDLIYTISNGSRARIMVYNVASPGWQEVKSFQNEADGGIIFHLTMSDDEDVFAFYVVKEGTPRFLVWRRSTDTLQQYATSGPNSILPAGYVLNEVDIDKSGKYLIVAVNLPQGTQYEPCVQGFAGTPSGKVLNIETGVFDTFNWCDTDDPPGHGGLGRGVIVGQAPFAYGLNKRLLGDIHRFAKLFSPVTAAGEMDFTENFHGSMLGDEEGWITIGTYDDDTDPNVVDYGIFEDEIYQVALDGSQRFRRLAHSRTNWVDKDAPGFNIAINGYWGAAKPTVSRDGRYIAFTSNWEEEDNRTDLLILKVPPAPQVHVRGRVFRPFGPVDLNAEGGLDWAHWGSTAANSFDHKAGVTQRISNYTVVGSGTPFQYGDNQFGYNWTGGTPTASAADTRTGVAVSGLNNGFQLTVPADTTSRTLRLYVGATQARGRIEAKLSGSPSPAYYDVSVDGSGGRADGVYTLNYYAQSDGQQLTVTYTLNRDYGSGSVSLQAATLAQSCTPPASPSLVISEFRLRGPAHGLGDGSKNEFVELYNNSDAPLTVCAADGSDGWALAARAASGASPAPVFTVPNGTMIPARGHYLATHRGPYAYNLWNHPAGNGATARGDITYTTNIANSSGLALFKSSNPANFILGNRLDAVGFAGETDALYKEGAGIPVPSPTPSATPGEQSYYRTNCPRASAAADAACRPGDPGTPQDSNNNAVDFVFADSNGAVSGAGQHLGVPGPENLSSPVDAGSSIAHAALSPSAADTASPNVVRDPTSDAANNSPFGTLDVRRTFTNNTGVPITRLRFRVAELSTLPAPTGAADLRPRSSQDVTVTVDGVPVTLRGTSPEQPPAGVGFNSALGVATVTPAAPLLPGASVSVRFLLGVKQTGCYRFGVFAESLPGGGGNLFVVAGSTEGSAGCPGAAPPGAGAGQLVISEFRVRGPNGANDEFVEVYNNTDLAHTVATTDGSAGYALAASDGVVRFTIPNGTNIPARGHYLGVNSAGYSLGDHPAGNGTTATGDATYTTDIPDNAGLALFNTSNPARFTFFNRFDAVGSTAEANLFYREGAGYPALTPSLIDYSFYRDDCGKEGSIQTFGPCPISRPRDTGDNAHDFIFIDTNGNAAGAGQRLGAPGPENLSSPISRTSSFGSNVLDPCLSASTPPNRVRDFTSDPANNSSFGTLDIRRTFTNNTGGNVTRLRFRVVDLTTFPAPSGIADLRPRTSTAVVQTVDREPCGAGTSNVTVQGTTLEGPPAQTNGGGFNSTLSAGTVTLATPLANGATIDVRFLLGVEQTGSFRFTILVEALP